MTCPVCGTEHQTSGCPGSGSVFQDTPPHAAPQTVTLNGLTFGEQAILDKLNEILKAIEVLDISRRIY